MSPEESAAPVTAIAALSDPVRRALYRFIARQDTPVSREEAAAGAGVAHHVARFHLDRLHEAGLLAVEYKRPAGRGGPGAGHPAKLYRPAATEYSVSVPERRYDIAGSVLTRAIAALLSGHIQAAAALEEAAGEVGRAIGHAAISPGGLPHQLPSLGAGIETLEASGFAPRAEAERYVLSNCPFRALAQQAPQVICRMNLALITGLLAQTSPQTASAHLDPADGRCCVTITRRAGSVPAAPAR